MPLLVGSRRALLSSGSSLPALDSPLEVPGLWAWYDPSDAATVTIGTGVSQINDKSGNGYNLTQGVGARQPPQGTAPNGLKVLNFASTGSMALGRTSVPFPSGGALTAFFVLNRTEYAAGADDVIMVHNNSTTTGFYVFINNNSGPSFSVAAREFGAYGKGFYYDAAPYSLVPNPVPFQTTGYHVLDIALSATAAETRIDGAIQTPRAAVPAAVDAGTGTLVLGNYTTGGSVHSWGGTMGDVLLFAAAVSKVNRARLRKFLRDKWGTP